MKEHPILFSGETVRAILDGRKTQTRRVVRPVPPDEYPIAVCDARGLCCWSEDGTDTGDCWPLANPKRCPYGAPGDHLWVRETLTRCQDSEASTPLALYEVGRQQVYHSGRPAPWTWRGEHCPSIFMQCWASRLALEIVKVRVERVQGISHGDAIAEGIADIDQGGDLVSGSYAITNYRALWNRLNAQRGYAWESNPWVWVIKFRRIDTGLPIG